MKDPVRKLYEKIAEDDVLQIEFVDRHWKQALFLSYFKYLCRQEQIL